MKMKQVGRSVSVAVASLSLAGLPLHASSHREAPLITQMPKLDSTDLYLFNSYEPGRSNFVTFVACYLPLQTPYGGPNFFTLDPQAVYEIHIDNDGDAKEDITFQFRFSTARKDIALTIGPPGNQRTNAIPLVQAGQITSTNNAALNVLETYTIQMIKGNRRTGEAHQVANATDSSTTFTKPVDYIGSKTLPDYDAYVNNYIYNIAIPGCNTPGRVLVAQRKDPFVVNLGETFDLVNFSNPLGPPDGERDSLDDDNVTAIMVELPKECLLGAPDKPIIGAWTTASKIDGTNITQVSRLGMPLVNELVIGIKDKDTFSMSEPKDDAQFADYVTHPTLPALVELLFGAAGVKAPTKFPRTDLVAVFATGVDGLNLNAQPGVIGEMVRLNTSIPAIPAAQQKRLGVLESDTAGFPNGRRPGDDVVDVALRVVMGVLLPLADAPSGPLAFTDGAFIDAKMFPEKFPYLNTPIISSPLEPEITITLQSAAQVQGPYRSIPATYDSAARTLTGTQPDPKTGYYRLKANGKVSLDGVKVEGTNVEIGVK
ncbi:MAG: DUF4331 domain-containing protein [Verrucomicrobiota bacterium]